jgi:nicotinamidase-related amidase
MKTKLLIIDPQNDFCEPAGSLFVPGADEDCNRLASFIKKNSQAIDAIHITLDSHSTYHIAHTVFWKNLLGQHPDPFTIINKIDIENGKYVPVDKNLTETVKKYVQDLEAKGHYKLTIWPMHCIIATWGNCVQKKIAEASQEWELHNPCKNIIYTRKAENPLTEQYSAIQAEVPVIDDEMTKINFGLIESLKKADKIIVAGEALSHCLANTVKDLCEYIPANKITVLTDCTSPVTGYDKDGTDFLDKMQKKGMSVAISSNLTL